ncbi:hypothetical protein [Synechococcus sp. BA-132 BA5]|uniref:hypothetical protein n=1 Tax=Synechococcus sp. BA-132 BA5 TaxID=3110252 RepID=UPI002B21838D|nr:hypothetical protein [Synechococcus sp. BA-132 BA5]MEA5416985.1 hypothetical protein [Synechococcus sp. BA-132 BA5]
MSTALLIGFAAACLLGLLPPQLLDPDWQWRFSGLLIDNGPVAVVAFGLLHLAAYVDAQNDRLQRRLAALGPWAAAAALGFLLLIPLQGLAVARGLSTASLQSSRQLRQVDSTLNQLRQDIQAAPDAATLQRRLPPSLASAIGPVALQQPLPQLRAQVLALVDQAQQRSSARLGGGVNPAALWPVIQRSLRVLLIAPAYAAAFAAMVFKPGAELSRLDIFLRSCSRLRLRPWRLGSTAKNANSSYLRSISSRNQQE